MFKDVSALRGDIKLPYDEIDNLYNKGKIPQLLTRFSYFNSNELDDIQWALLILAIMYENRKTYNISDFEILRLLAVFVNKYIKVNKNIQEPEKWLVKNFFSVLSIENQLILYGEIWKQKDENHLWGINEKSFVENVFEMFKKYLEGKKSESIVAYDYSIYGVYHRIKSLDKNKAKKLLVDFWNTSNIELLCTQITDFGSLTNIAFKLSDIAIELFDSKDNFVKFVESKSNDSEGILEFLKFFSILKIVGYSSETIFEFQKSELMKEKIRQKIDTSSSSSDNDEYENTRQIIIESNDIELFDEVIANKFIDHYNFKRIILGDMNYMVVYFNKTFSKKSIANEFIKKIFDIAPNAGWGESISYMDIFNEGIINGSTGKYVKLFSVQPPLD